MPALWSLVNSKEGSLEPKRGKRGCQPSEGHSGGLTLSGLLGQCVQACRPTVGPAVKQEASGLPPSLDGSFFKNDWNGLHSLRNFSWQFVIVGQGKKGQKKT